MSGFIMEPRYGSFNVIKLFKFILSFTIFHCLTPIVHVSQAWPSIAITYTVEKNLKVGRVHCRMDYCASFCACGLNMSELPHLKKSKIEYFRALYIFDIIIIAILGIFKDTSGVNKK